MRKSQTRPNPRAESLFWWRKRLIKRLCVERRAPQPWTQIKCVGRAADEDVSELYRGAANKREPSQSSLSLRSDNPAEHSTLVFPNHNKAVLRVFTWLRCDEILTTICHLVNLHLFTRWRTRGQPEVKVSQNFDSRKGSSGDAVGAQDNCAPPVTNFRNFNRKCCHWHSRSVWLMMRLLIALSILRQWRLREPPQTAASRSLNLSQR